jgi:hypothetical protein
MRQPFGGAFVWKRGLKILGGLPATILELLIFVAASANRYTWVSPLVTGRPPSLAWRRGAGSFCIGLPRAKHQEAVDRSRHFGSVWS